MTDLPPIRDAYTIQPTGVHTSHFNNVGHPELCGPTALTSGRPMRLRMATVISTTCGALVWEPSTLQTSITSLRNPVGNVHRIVSIEKVGGINAPWVIALVKRLDREVSARKKEDQAVSLPTLATKSDLPIALRIFAC
mgnify:CR=1 FL=1